MEQQEIKYLLEKYYSADTDLSEEKQLREYFLGETVAQDFQASRDQFIFFSGLAEERPEAAGLEDKIMANLFKVPPVVPLRKKKTGPILYRIITAVAAGILLIFVMQSLEESFSSGMKADKLTTSMANRSCGNPDDCYNCTNEALQLMSAAISTDKTRLEKVLGHNYFAVSKFENTTPSIVVNREMLSKLSGKKGAQPKFQSLIRGISTIKISKISGDVKSNSGNEIEAFLEKMQLLPQTHLLSRSESTDVSVYVVDLPENEQQYILHQRNNVYELLIELSGSVDLSNLKGYGQ